MRGFPTLLVHFSIQNEFIEANAAAVIILDECGVFGRKRREMWAKNWLLGRDRFTHSNLLNFIRNDSP
jgi:hypothetical protein